MSNTSFETFWRAHKQTILTMLQPTTLNGISAEQYQENQTKLAAELIYQSGAKDGGAQQLDESVQLLKVISKELAGQPLSAEQKAYASLLDKSELPDFLKGQAG